MRQEDQETVEHRASVLSISEFPTMLEIMSKYLWHCMGDASECESFITKLATRGYSQREAFAHFLDNMAGTEQGMF